MSRATLFTIGHSSRSSETLIEMLTAHGVTLLVDVRAFPRSRRHPQFNRNALEAALAAAGIDYRWSGTALGGFRKPRADSPHTALTDAAFRGFADHMSSPAFERAAGELLALAERERIALMCAEVNHRHCHRQFIADWLARRGLAVRHVLGDGAAVPHHPHPCLDDASDPPVYNRHEQGELFSLDRP